MSSSVDTDEIFLETSILVDLAQKGDESDCYELFQNHSVSKTTSPYVRTEFDGKKANREYIIKYFQEKIGTNDSDFSDFSPPDDEHLTNQDIQYARGLIGELASIDDPIGAQKELDSRRKLFRSIRVFLFGDEDSEDDVGYLPVYPAELDENLLGNLRSAISNRDDRRIIAEAADWANEEGYESVVTQDRGDMISNESAINNSIEMTRGFDCVLAIYHIQKFLQRIG